MLEDEVDEESDVEALVVGWDYDTVLVLRLLHSSISELNLILILKVEQEGM